MEKLPVCLCLSIVGGIYGCGIVFAAMFFCVPYAIGNKQKLGTNLGVLAAFVGLCFGMWVSSTARLSVYTFLFVIFFGSSFAVSTNVI